MLKERGVTFEYREYTQDPLTAEEIRDLLGKLGLRPQEVLRARDAKPAGLTGDEPDEILVQAMAANPRLLQRPIGVMGERAVVGRPVEALLTLALGAGG